VHDTFDFAGSFLTVLSGHFTLLADTGNSTPEQHEVDPREGAKAAFGINRGVLGGADAWLSLAWASYVS